MPNSGADGNDTQARIMARQLFDTWKAEQELEARENRRWWQGNAGGWLGIIVVIVGAIAGASNIHSLAEAADTRSRENETEIAAMRVNNADRLARIETKVDRLLEDKR